MAAEHNVLKVLWAVPLTSQRPLCIKICQVVITFGEKKNKQLVVDCLPTGWEKRNGIIAYLHLSLQHCLG